jgi:hypothetical protein
MRPNAVVEQQDRGGRTETPTRKKRSGISFRQLNISASATARKSEDFFERSSRPGKAMFQRFTEFSRFYRIDSLLPKTFPPQLCPAAVRDAI